MTRNMDVDAVARAVDMRANTTHSNIGNELMYESCLDALPLFIVIVERGGKVVWLNRKAIEITGFDNEHARGRKWFDEDQIKHIIERSDGLSATHAQNNVSNLILPLAHGSEEIVSGWFLPIDNAVQSDGQVVFVSSSICELISGAKGVCITGHDELTGLAGRNMAYEQLKHSMAKARRRKGKVGVIFFDVDDFKKINDVYGHVAGDHVLKVVAGRLQGAIRESDMVARIGGDEFLVILNEIDDVMDCEVVTEKVVDVFSEAIDLGDKVVTATTSMGISIFPDDGVNCDEIVSNADAAMYYAKKSGKNKFHYFTGEINRVIQDRLTLDAMLRDAVKNNNFVVMYQPIVETESGKVERLEALVRWQHNDKLVFPSAFLPAAEESGIIVPIGEAVMHRACSDAVAWSDVAGEQVCVTVNVSLRQWMSGGMPGLVNEVLQETGIEPSCLQLELTEKSLFYNFDYVYEQIQQLCDMGVELSLDDFGVGYSSLSCIDTVPLSTVKIDGGKVRRLAERVGDMAFCQAVTSMTHSYSKKVVAEEVENARQLRYLRQIGVDYVQGSYISMPLHRDAVDFLFA